MDKRLVFIGALLYGSLYLEACLLAALVWGNHLAALATILALGLAFLSYCGHLAEAKGAAMIIVAVGWALAVCAGVLLIF